MNPAVQIIVAPSGERLAVLPEADYLLLLAASEDDEGDAKPEFLEELRRRWQRVADEGEGRSPLSTRSEANRPERPRALTRRLIFPHGRRRSPAIFSLDEQAELDGFVSRSLYWLSLDAAASHCQSARPARISLAMREGAEDFEARAKILRGRLRSAVDSSEIIQADRDRDGAAWIALAVGLACRVAVTKGSPDWDRSPIPAAN
jgi:hypothetical protein